MKVVVRRLKIYICLNLTINLPILSFHTTYWSN